MIDHTFDAAQLERALPALLTLPQWVCWRAELRANAKGERRQTKVPINPHTGAFADSQRPQTWASFDQAVKRARREGIGVGFVFRAGGTVFGLDLDKCLNPATGTVAPWALRHVQQLRSYTEVTPSGTGLHVLGLATPPASGRRTGQIELYGAGASSR
jgi:putative DNA primase/helicase